MRSEVNSIDAGETKKAALEATLVQKKAKAAQLSADIAALQAKQSSMEASLVPPAQRVEYSLRSVSELLSG